ncbi:hypothetical protein RQM65_03850 [Pricia sp. S334]|uniref:DUF748 domain-containing protein n=1 Tax=Pricia mediterranea TaxID=3076079 RepID=A0ABU3L3G5_9FLAO|nr:hypothetical protein [Pricia sp. S334]MDT7827798.1 hypothetical protein [Pricia sp. S334]
MFKKLTKRPLLLIFFLLLTVIVAAVVLAQFMAKDALSDYLDRKLPKHVQLQYENMEVNLIDGTIALQDIALDFYDHDSMVLNTTVRMDGMALKGLAYWDFLVNKEIYVRRLLLERPRLRHYPYRMQPKKETEPMGVVELLKAIEIGEFSVEEGTLTLLRETSDSVAFAVNDVNFSIDNIRTDPERITKKIPVTYEAYELNADSLYVNLGPFEKLNVTSLTWNQSYAKIAGLRLHSKYSKTELSRQLSVERDHIDLQIPEMKLDSIRFGFEKNTLYIHTGSGIIKKPDLEMYRDKLIADDTKNKKLYSRSLRELPIHIEVPKVEIANGRISYSEQVTTNASPGKLLFENLNATILNISNTYPEGDKTEIKARTKFMGDGDMTLDWSFDVNHDNDAFLAAGTVSNFNTERINPFLESNLRAKASGTIEQMYFTVSGNGVSASGDIKMKYDDFRFQVLKKDGSGVNRFLTAIGNLFVDSGSDTDAEGFRHGNIYAERDPTKSFFNYLWLNVQDGTISVLTGNGEKE